MIAALGAVVGAYGVFLLYTSLQGWRGLGVGPTLRARNAKRPRRLDWLAQAGLAEVRPIEFASVVATLALGGVGLGLLLFGGPLPALVIGAFAGTFPVAWYRERRLRRRSEAHEAWPR